MTFDRAQDLFRAAPTNKRAGAYLKVACEYEGDDIIGDDTFLNAIAEVAYWLSYGKRLVVS